MEQFFMAQIVMFGGNFAPRSWAFCDGTLLAISQNDALFSLLGTIYGGDGRTTFGLPDLRGRVAIGFGSGPGLSHHNIGTKSGTESVTLSSNQIPSHKHSVSGTSVVSGTVGVQVANVAVDSADPNSGAFAQAATYHSGGANGNYSHVNANFTVGGSTANSGGSRDHTNMQPFLCVNFIIATQGIYPSRH